jgi:uncharacterized protein with PQ loop repeat
MSDAAVTITLGWVAAALGTWSAFAQYARLRRRGAQGVSLSTWTLFVALALFWVAYGVAVRSWPLATSSALALPVQAMIWWRLGPGVRRGAVARALAVALASCLAPAFLWGWAGAVVGAGVAGTVTRLPQLARLVRSSDVTGVSRGSWALAALVSAMWVAYYARSRLWAVLSVTAVAGSVSLGVAMVAAWRQRPSRAITGRG